MTNGKPLSLLHAVRPGRAPRSAPSEPILFHDPPQQIARCLSCQKKTCTNCISGEPSHQQRLRRATFLELYHQGLSDAEIGRRMGLQRQAVYRRRRRLSLPPNP